MSTQTQSDLQNEEKYAIEFSDFELNGYEPEAEDEEIENEYRCPVCESHELQYMMHYSLSADDATTELYQCGQCGAMGEADDCRIEADDTCPRCGTKEGRENRGNPGGTICPVCDWWQAGTLPPAITQTDNQPNVGDTTVMERWDPASGTWYQRKLVWDGKQYVPAAPAARKPATTEDDIERARRYGKGDQEVAA